jgi:hypothetical protein
MTDTPFEKADKFFIRAVASILLVAGSIFGVANFDKPMSTGESVWGTVVSIASVPTGYRHLTGKTKANIRLDNGSSLQAEISGASEGMRVEFRVTKTRVLGRVAYHAVRSS